MNEYVNLYSAKLEKTSRALKKNYNITCCDIRTSAIRFLPVVIVGRYQRCDYSLTYHNIAIPQYQTAATDCDRVEHSSLSGISHLLSHF